MTLSKHIQIKKNEQNKFWNNVQEWMQVVAGQVAYYKNIYSGCVGQATTSTDPSLYLAENARFFK